MTLDRFLTLAPVLCLGLTIYLAIFVSHLRRLAPHVGDFEKEAMIFNLPSVPSRILTALLIVFQPAFLLVFLLSKSSYSTAVFLVLPAIPLAVLMMVFAWGVSWPTRIRNIANFSTAGLAFLVIVVSSINVPQTMQLVQETFRLNLDKIDFRRTTFIVDEQNNFKNLNLHAVVARGANFAELKLIGHDLSASDLTDSDFSGATLEGINFRSATLHRLRARNAQFFNVDGHGADLVLAKLARSRFQNSSFAFAVLNFADLSDVEFHGSMYSASLIGAGLRRASLKHVSLEGADLRDADLRGANLEGADLRNAQMGLHPSISRYRDFLDGWDTLAFPSWKEVGRTDLRGVTGLDCQTLAAAVGWEEAARDPALACGAPIPEPPSPDYRRFRELPATPFTGRGRGVEFLESSEGSANKLKQ